MTPPSHINVLRTALGRVETVPFRRYVDVVMAAEWGPENPREALAAGAVAIKQYAWYYAMAGNWRGGSAGGRCFDVRDTTADQLYRPATKIPTRRHLAAVAESWLVTVRKPGFRSDGGFFATQYNNGSDFRRCGTGLTGHTLRQVGAASCAAGGYTFRQILRLYYGPGARIVTSAAPPAPRRPADIGLLFQREPVIGQHWPMTDALVLKSDGKGVKAGPDQPLGFPLDAMLGHTTADLTGDRRADLGVLLTSAEGPLISVFPSGDDRFGPAIPWWRGSGLGPDLASARVFLISGDWGTGRSTDLGLVVQDRDGGGPTKIYELAAGPDGGRQAALVWEGDPGGIVWAAYGGDFSGDGHSDVALVVDAGAGGVRFLVLAGSGDAGPLPAPRTWATATDVGTGTAVPLLADVDGDGREDIVVAAADGASGLRFTAYRSTGTGFDTVELGTAADGFPWPNLRIGAADLDGDGRDDVSVLVPDAGGARVEAFLSHGRGLSQASWGNEADVDLAGATTF